MGRWIDLFLRALATAGAYSREALYEMGTAHVVADVDALLAGEDENPMRTPEQTFALRVPSLTCRPEQAAAISRNNSNTVDR